MEPDYHPLPTVDVAPTQGGSVALVTIVKGVGTPQLNPTGSLKFSGYDWRVRMMESWQDETDWLCTVEFLAADDPEARLFAADIIGQL